MRRDWQVLAKYTGSSVEAEEPVPTQVYYRTCVGTAFIRIKGGRKIALFESAFYCDHLRLPLVRLKELLQFQIGSKCFNSSTKCMTFKVKRMKH